MKTEVLSVLIAVGWIALSFYLNAKKKNKQPSENIPEEGEVPDYYPQSEYEEGSESTFPDSGTLQQFDFEKYFQAESQEGQSLENFFETEFDKKYEPLKVPFNVNAEHEKAESEQERDDFDLRQAVIYQAILERKYN